VLLLLLLLPETPCGCDAKLRKLSFLHMILFQTLLSLNARMKYIFQQDMFGKKKLTEISY